MEYKQIEQDGILYNVEMMDDGSMGSVQPITSSANRTNQDAIKGDIQTSPFEASKIDQMEETAEGVQDFFMKDFYNRFPQFKDSPENQTLMNVSATDLDALTHFYGNVLAQEKFGTPMTVLAGLFNEARGLWGGNTMKGTMADLVNNFSALASNSGKTEHANMLSQLIKDSTYNPTNEQLINLINYGLDRTIDPPWHEKYPVSPSDTYRGNINDTGQ